MTESLQTAITPNFMLINLDDLARLH